MDILGKKDPAYKKQRKLQQKQDQAQMQVKRKSGSGKFIVAAVVIIVVIIAAYFLLFLNVNQVVISNPTTVNITSAGNLYGINSNQYYISLSTISVSSGTAYVHITKFPVFVNPLLNVTLTLNNITKLNLGTNYSNLGIQLQSLSANSITVKISPLFTSLQIAPSSQDIRVIQTNLYGSGGNQNSGPTTLATTTISGASTTISSNTISSTTVPASTTIAANATAAAITEALQKDVYYGLMLNFSVLYSNTSNCNTNLYNNLYVEQNGHLPAGPYTYDNVSPYTPYNLSSAKSPSSAGTFNVTFEGKTVALGNLPAVTINVNPTTKATVDTIAPASASGIFADLTLAQIQQNYATAKSQGACGVMLG